MNLNEGNTMSQILNVTATETKPKKKEGISDKSSERSGQRVCRICLEEEYPENELICPCKCAGTMKYIHVDCLKEWLDSKKLTYNGEKVKSFFWKALECELCKAPFENVMKGRLFNIMNFECPGEDYLIMESVKSAPAKVVHVFNLSKGNEFRVGRSVDTDMKIADISVSRVHSFIRIINNRLFIEDNGAKFGTMVKICDPFEIV